MSGNNDTPIDIESMSDEDFMKLDPSDLEEYTPSEEEEIEEVELVEELQENEEENDQEVEDDSVNEESVDDDQSTVSEEEEAGTEDTDTPEGESESDPEEAKDGEESNAEKPDEPAPESTDNEESETEQDDVKLSEADTQAVDFFNKVSAPFTADGKQTQVRSPEDAIRLMQMGVNYSRRMEELKPARAQQRMLVENGIDDPEKLNFLIDVSKGNPDAIKKLLKDHEIDPIDIDTTTETSYQANEYREDPKSMAFNEAIDTTIQQEGGPDLIREINRNWDDSSKEALRDQPDIFQNVLAQQRSGVYEQIKTEVDYQRTMGFLKNVPFLQAYHQVGMAMQKQGVFDKKPEAQPETPKPLGTGTRKVTQPKIEQPNPNISSATTPRSAPKAVNKKEVDYSTMSDDDFKKLAPPS